MKKGRAGRISRSAPACFFWKNGRFCRKVRDEFILSFPDSECFERFVFGHSELVEAACGRAIAIDCFLPWIAQSFGERGKLVFLRIVFEDRAGLQEKFFRSERDGDIDLVDFPFVCGTVESDRAVVLPRFSAELVESEFEGFETELSNGVWIGERSGDVDFVGFDFCKEFGDLFDIFIREMEASRTVFVKREIEESG